MSQDTQFKKLARRAYVSYHQDGLLDLLIGWIMVALGVCMATGWAGGLGIASWVPIVIYVPLKNRITIPRLGYVQFAPDPGREALRKVVYPLAFCLFMVILLLGVGLPEGASPPAPVWTPADAWPFLRDWLQASGRWLLGLAALLGFGVIGLATGIRRMFVYAGLSLVILTGGQLLGFRSFIAMFILGGIVLAAGIVILVRFLKKYPLPSEEETALDENINHVTS